MTNSTDVRFAWLLASAVLVACGDANPGAGPGPDAGDAFDVGTDGESDAEADPSDGQADDIAATDPLPALPGTAVLLDPAADTSDPAAFWHQPFPTDARLTRSGAPDWSGLPHPATVDLIDGVIAQAADRTGFPAMPVVFFAFDGPIAAQDPDDVIPAAPDAPIWIAELSAASPPQLTPAIARTLPPDAYTPSHMLAVAPRPGYVLDANTTYAVVVLRSLGDSAGNRLGVPASVRNLLAGIDVPGLTASLWTEHGPRVAALAEALGADVDDVAGFSVFTTGDPAEELRALSDALLEQHSASVAGLRLAAGGESHARFCHLTAVAELPQFQVGVPPFADGGGTFIPSDATGLPVLQRTERVPITLTIPRQPMPEAGYPYVLYLHGSGGTSTQVVDRGPVLEPGGPRTPGLGPAHVLAGRGIATVGTALPINPERVPGATDISYIVANPLAFRDNIRQGTIEQRMLYRALRDVVIAPELLASCGAGFVDSEPARLDSSTLLLMGQSQGGHYVNVVAAVEPEVDVVVPTGAGGFMSWLVLEQPRNNLRPILAAILGSTSELDYTHPAMALLQTAWEPVEPLLYMARLHHRPLSGRGPLSVYAPVAEGDSFYPTAIYDAVALAYRSPLAGPATWPSLGVALGDAGVATDVSLPLRGNVYSGDATAAIAQYEGDGLEDPHSIFSQLDTVKYQYACFFRTHLDHGLATLGAPAAIDADCPAPR